MFINILQVTRWFYLIEAIDANTSKRELFRKSHAKWYEDWVDYKNFFFEKLATAIYDYTVACVLGEMRWARSKAAHYYPGIESQEGNRHFFQTEAGEYSDQQILEKAIWLFGDEWQDSYGGTPWLDIAKACTKKWTLPNEVFIDHMVDMAHNNGTYFDKQYIFQLNDKHGFQNFLDYKRYGNILTSVLQDEPLPYDLSQLVIRAMALGFIPSYEDLVEPIPYEEEIEIYKYIPIAYKGNIIIKAPEIGQGVVHCAECGCTIYIDDGEFTSDKDSYYCSDCSKVCDRCGELQTPDRITEYRDKQYCSYCLSVKKRQVEKAKEEREALKANA